MSSDGGTGKAKDEDAAEIPAWALRPRTGGSEPSPPPDADAAAKDVALGTRPDSEQLASPKRLDLDRALAQSVEDERADIAAVTRQHRDNGPPQQTAVGDRSVHKHRHHRQRFPGDVPEGLWATTKRWNYT